MESLEFMIAQYAWNSCIPPPPLLTNLRPRRKQIKSSYLKKADAPETREVCKTPWKELREKDRKLQIIEFF